MTTRQLNFIAITLISLPLIRELVFFSIPSSVAMNNWGMTEWLISYDAGFVRRGLAGEIISSISALTWLPPPWIAVFTSITAYIGLIYVVIKKIRLKLPVYLILSPLFLGLPVYSNFLIRKDVLQILLLAIILLIIKNKGSRFAALFANLITCIATANHEAFAFFGLPLVMISYSIVFYKKIFSLHSLLIFSPSVFFTILCFTLKGDLATSSIITKNWNALLSTEYNRYCCLNESSAAIGAIGWSTFKGLSLSLSVLNDFLYDVFWVPLIWILNFSASLILISQFFFKDHQQRQGFYKIALIQTCLISPLFVLGWDFGRWIFYINSSAIIWVGLFSDYQPTKHNFFKFEVFRFVDRLPHASLFFFAIPSCCWTISYFIQTTPIVSIIHSVRGIQNNLMSAGLAF